MYSQDLGFLTIFTLSDGTRNYFQADRSQGRLPPAPCSPSSLCLPDFTLPLPLAFPLPLLLDLVE